MVNSRTVACLFATLAVLAVHGGAQSAPSQAPVEGPATDCMSLMYNMMDCMSYLSNGGNETKPDDSCCSGFKSVVETNADCICVGLSSSVSLGLDINMTKAQNLPSACGVSGAPTISSCNVSNSPEASPVNAPSVSAPSLSPTTQPPAASSDPEVSPESPTTAAQAPASDEAAEAPVFLTAASEQAPAPAPTKSGACTNSFSSFVSTMAISFSIFSALAN